MLTLDLVEPAYSSHDPSVRRNPEFAANAIPLRPVSERFRANPVDDDLDLAPRHRPPPSRLPRYFLRHAAEAIRELGRTTPKQPALHGVHEPLGQRQMVAVLGVHDR